jgi:4'-phosphopantetheinyl transferase
VVLRLAEDVAEPRLSPLLALLDAVERARATRFVFARLRVEFVAAHALARIALAGATGAPADAFRFRTGPNGKPEAFLDGLAVPAAFSLSHTRGMVGVAVTTVPGLRLGFDLEAAKRMISANVASKIFRPEELRWLGSLPSEAQASGMMRLWTLTEAFIKATGLGLSEDLSTFWFEPPLVIRFAPNAAEAGQTWSFAQRFVIGEVFAAVAASPVHDLQVAWEETSLEATIKSLLAAQSDVATAH